MRDIPTITKDLIQLSTLSGALSERFQAYCTLHRVACVHNDHDEMRQRREELHTVLDVLLDNGESIQIVTRELQDASDKQKG